VRRGERYRVELEREILAFHAQQAVEKALKALLVQHQVEFPYTHAIGPLLNLCQAAGFEGTEALGDAAILTRYAVAARYPGEQDPVSRQEAREAASLATRSADLGRGAD
jgi:HEPN domain-containing protein